MGECRRFGNSRPKTRGGRGLLDLVYRVRSIGFGGDVEEKDCGVTGAVWNLKGLVGWFACVGTDTTTAPGATGLFDCIASDAALGWSKRRCLAMSMWAIPVRTRLFDYGRVTRLVTSPDFWPRGPQL